MYMQIFIYFFRKSETEVKIRINIKHYINASCYVPFFRTLFKKLHRFRDSNELPDLFERKYWKAKEKWYKTLRFSWDFLNSLKAKHLLKALQARRCSWRYFSICPKIFTSTTWVGKVLPIVHENIWFPYTMWWNSQILYTAIFWWVPS